MKEENEYYKQLCYDLLYSNKELHKKIKELEEELDILKRNQNNNIKDVIIKELIMYKKRRRR